VSEALLGEVEGDERLDVLEEPRPMRFERGEIVPRSV
jgi:hypothetical protein